MKKVFMLFLLTGCYNNPMTMPVPIPTSSVVISEGSTKSFPKTFATPAETSVVKTEGMIKYDTRVSRGKYGFISENNSADKGKEGFISENIGPDEAVIVLRIVWPDQE